MVGVKKSSPKLKIAKYTKQMESAKNAKATICVREINESVSTDKTECHPLDNSMHCLSYTRLNCSKCKKDYIMMEDFYDYFFNTDSMDYLDNLYFFLTLKQKQKNLIRKSFCQVAEVSNCVEYLNPKECLKCKEQYILTIVQL
jgi:hypothetical protein